MSAAQGFAPVAPHAGRTLPLSPRVTSLSVLASPVLFWGLLAVLCLVRGFVGLYGTRSYSHDAFMVLDGAWRMLHGQRPHVDFNSMVGPLAYLPTLAGLLLTGDSAAGYGWGQALSALFAGAWAYTLGTGLSAPARSLFALCAAAVTISPALIGPTPLDIGPGMTYNRLSYGLLSLLLLDFFQERGPTSMQRGLSSGAVLGLLLFLKMTTFAAGLASVLVFLFLRPRARRFVTAMLLAALAVITAFLVYLHCHVGLILQDLAMTAAAKRIAFGSLYLYTTIFFEAAVALIFVNGASVWLGEYVSAPEARWVRSSGTVVVVLSCLLLFGNYQHSELPLIPFFTILIADRIAQKAQRGRGASARAMLGYLRTAFVAVTLGAVAVALVTGVRARLYTVRYAPHFVAPALNPFVPVANDYGYVTYVNDGLQMLERNRQPGEHVMSLDFTNPFSFGLHIPPAPGGTTNLQFHGSFDGQHKLTPERLFGASELVMLTPTPSDISLVHTIDEIYGPYLQAHYHVIDRDKSWILYRRNGQPPSS